MSTFNTLVAGTAGVIGWLVVSYLLDKAKSKRPDAPQDSPAARDTSSGASREPPLPIAHDQSPRAPGHVLVPTSVRDIPGSHGPASLDEIGRTWHTILGVSSEAGAEEIERAYYARLAECDRGRLAADTSSEVRQSLERQRALLTQAFEFIRPLRP